jgi:nitroreductase
MNEAIKNILERRSVRLYMKTQIKDEDLKIIPKCALYAPTGGNVQCSRFIVIRDTVTLEELILAC